MFAPSWKNLGKSQGSRLNSIWSKLKNQTKNAARSARRIFPKRNPSVSSATPKKRVSWGKGEVFIATLFALTLAGMSYLFDLGATSNISWGKIFLWTGGIILTLAAIVFAIRLIRKKSAAGTLKKKHVAWAIGVPLGALVILAAITFLPKLYHERERKMADAKARTEADKAKYARLYSIPLPAHDTSFIFPVGKYWSKVFIMQKSFCIHTNPVDPLASYRFATQSDTVLVVPGEATIKGPPADKFSFQALDDTLDVLIQYKRAVNGRCPENQSVAEYMDSLTRKLWQTKPRQILISNPLRS